MNSRDNKVDNRGNNFQYIQGVGSQGFCRPDGEPVGTQKKEKRQGEEMAHSPLRPGDTILDPQARYGFPPPFDEGKLYAVPSRSVRC